MNLSLLELTERLVPISDFSQGKAGKILEKPKKKQPYWNDCWKKNENICLLKFAEGRANDNTDSLEAFVGGLDLSLSRQLSDPVPIVDLQKGGDALEELVGVQAADHHHRGGLHHEGHEEGQGQDDAPDAD